MNWRVAELPDELIDFVIVRELLHLRIPQGEMWKGLISEYISDWKKKEERLKEMAR